MRQPRGVEILDAVTAKALENEEYKRQLLADPVKVLRNEGLTIPDGVNVVIHENTADTIHLVLPSQPAKAIDLDQTDLTMIAHHTGGT
jgi:Nitrile hydratase, alpha chain